MSTEKKHTYIIVSVVYSSDSVQRKRGYFQEAYKNHQRIFHLCAPIDYYY